MLSNNAKWTLTIEQIKTYLIDCIGYSNEDLKDLAKDNLMELVDSQVKLNQFCQ